jgi:hypothetical protein
MRRSIGMLWSCGNAAVNVGGGETIVTAEVVLPSRAERERRCVSRTQRA